MTLRPPILGPDEFAEVVDALASIDVCWERLLQTSQEIVLFGSRAAGLAHERSDWDILCVGHGCTRRTPRIDLLWVTPEERCSHTWLTGELAGHVARWGKWLAGEPTWTDTANPGPEACREKRRRITRRVTVWEPSWPLCSARLRTRYALALRRDLQRHERLLHGQAVPPSALLDQDWSRQLDGEKYLREVASHAGVDTNFVCTELIPIAAQVPARDALDPGPPRRQSSCGRSGCRSHDAAPDRALGDLD